MLTWMAEHWLLVSVLLGAPLLLALFRGPLLGLVVIGERQVGIVSRKFARQSLPPGRLVALHGEAGYQADTPASSPHSTASRSRRARSRGLAEGLLGILLKAKAEGDTPSRS